MSQSDDLLARARAHFAAGRWDEGMPLLLQHLDGHPSDEEAVDDLAAAATIDPSRAGELFARLERATRAAPEVARRHLRWVTLSHAACFGDRERLLALAAHAEDLCDAHEPERAAQLGALLAELDRIDQAKLLLRRASPLAIYHLARLVVAWHGASVEAARLLAGLAETGPFAPLRAIGEAALALPVEGPARAQAFFAHAGSILDLPPTVVSEGLLLHILVARAAKDEPQARAHARRMAASAAFQDPSALLRAATEVGPLPAILRP